MGIGSSKSEDKDDVRFRQELIHQELLGEIEPSHTIITPHELLQEVINNGSEHFSDAHNHLS